MKKLTQAIFDGAPDWVESAAVDSDSTVYWYNANTAQLVAVEGSHHVNAYDYDIGDGVTGVKVKEVGEGFDATDWQNSAIDKGDDD